MPALETFGISLLPYFPLAYGLLTGKYKRDQAPETGTRLAKETFRYDGADFDIVETLQRFADDRGITLLDVAIGGLLAQPAVGSVISGATRPEQIDANVRAAGWDPSAEDLAELGDIVAPGSGNGYHLRLMTTGSTTRAAGGVHDELARARLYLCTDARRERGDLGEFVARAVTGGVDIVQLRDKGVGRGGAVPARSKRPGNSRSSPGCATSPTPAGHCCR